MGEEGGGVPGAGLAAPADRTQRVAVFVDVENVLGWLKRGGCTVLLARARELGVVSIRRAFGDFSNPTVASRQVELQRHGFDLVHTLHPAKGKSNSADISMTIDVMESCRGTDIQWVMLATGDSDFGPVFRRLRELGKGVVGVGPSSVLSSSVALSCHEFIFTDDDSGRSGSAKKGRGKGVRGGDRAGATATWAGGGGGGRGALRTRLATPPQLLSARGGFRFKRQPSPGEDGGRLAAGVGAGVGAGAAFGVGGEPSIDWTGMLAPSTPPPVPSPKFDLSEAFSGVALGEKSPPAAPAAPAATAEPVLSPGQLLLPGMVTAAAAAAAAGAAAVSPAVSTELPARASSPGTTRALHGDCLPQTGRGVVGGAGTSDSLERRGSPSAPSPPPPPLMPPAFGGLGALSVIRPSEKLYRHLLALDSSAPATSTNPGVGGTGSLASDWGNGLSEVTVARGLVSLAEACGGQNGEQARAMEALGGFFDDNGGSSGGGRGGGLGREEAFRVASLLQRCGFLSWVAKEQQWLVTVPADVEVLRRRRDEAMMEELLIRCQEAGVPFEPALAANLLWSRGGTEAVGLGGGV
eukprot:g6969.t1